MKTQPIVILIASMFLGIIGFSVCLWQFNNQNIYMAQTFGAIGYMGFVFVLLIVGIWGTRKKIPDTRSIGDPMKKGLFLSDYYEVDLDRDVTVYNGFAVFAAFLFTAIAAFLVNIYNFISGLHMALMILLALLIALDFVLVVFWLQGKRWIRQYRKKSFS
jgi:hypothetical protein